jgi:hypothetical protein
MRRAALLLILLGGCSSSADRELGALKSAHSIVAEWAEVARLESQGRVGATYAQVMEAGARSQLESARREFRDPSDPAARLIDRLAGSAPDASQLDAGARRLAALEQSREAL